MDKENLVGVRFKADPLTHYYRSRTDLSVGDFVIVESQIGSFVGEVIVLCGKVKAKYKDSPEIKEQISKKNVDALDVPEKEKKSYLKEFSLLIKKHSLSMKPLDVEYSISGGLIFLFSSEHRVDFRDLVKELMHKLDSQITLKQVGARDCARMVDGFGPCGRRVCCRQFLGVSEGTTMDMARLQGMGGKGAAKISGCCGKLMCCLRFENDCYKKALSSLPKVGDKIKTKKGNGIVCFVDILRNKVEVELEDKSKTEVIL